MAEPLDRTHILQIQAAFQAGFRQSLEEFGKAKPYMSLSQFLTRFGKGIGQNWIDEGLIVPIRHGKNTSKWLIPVQRAYELAVAYHPELICERKKKTPNPKAK